MTNILIFGATHAAGLQIIAQHAAALPERPDAPLVTLLHLHKEA